MNNLTKYLIEDITNTNKVMLLGGNFSPPTSGHFNLVKKALEKNQDVDKFIIFVGNGTREGIDQKTTMDIWKIYEKHLGTKIEFKSVQTPITSIYDYAKENPDTEVIWVLGTREGDEKDEMDVVNRTKSISKYPNIKVDVIKTTGGVSGTIARKAFKTGNKEEFYKYLPTEISDDEKEQIWNILLPIVKELKDNEIRFWALYANIYNTLAKDPDKNYNILKDKLKNEPLVALNYFYNEYFKNGVSTMNENLIRHAQDELNRAGLFDKDSDYGGMIGDAVFKLIQTFSEQGHSGFSAEWVSDLFNKLSRYETLTPITSNPEEWEDVSHYGSSKNNILWQNNRNPSYFSKDGGKTWYNVDDKVIKEGIKKALNKFQLLNESIITRQRLKELVDNIDKPKDYQFYIDKLTDYCCSNLGIEKPIIILITDDSYTKANNSFGGYLPQENKIFLVIKDRNLADCCRTLSHEIFHHYQNQNNELTPEAGKDGDQFENEANAFSGETMRKFGKENPEIFFINV